ncbi:MAG: PIN domain-containing protein [Flavobacteriales bacterium]
MKTKFKAWNRKNPDEIKVIWDSGLITFDTNVLLGLYRVPSSLSDRFFDIVKKLGDRVFITNHVALEFHKNRFNVIVDNYSSLSKLNKEIDQFEKQLNESKFQNYLSDKAKKTLKEEIVDKKTKLEARKKYYEDLEKKDVIYDKLDQLLKDKIEEPFDEKELEEIFKEGGSRYKKLIPPGYKDHEKDENKYGDLVIWKEIIRKAKSEKKSIVFISDEKKEDWIWAQKDKKRIGPRPELLIEIEKEANVQFSINTLSGFIVLASRSLNIDIDEARINQEFREEYIFENVPNTSINEKIQKLQMEKAETIIILDALAIRSGELDETERNLKHELEFKLSFLNEEIVRIQNKTYAK